MSDERKLILPEPAKAEEPKKAFVSAPRPMTRQRIDRAAYLENLVARLPEAKRAEFWDLLYESILMRGPRGIMPVHPRTSAIVDKVVELIDEAYGIEFEEYT